MGEHNEPKPLYYESIVRIENMHNIISYNQLVDWSYDESEEDVINDYFDCLIECEDEQGSCKRICKEILV